MIDKEHIMNDMKNNNSRRKSLLIPAVIVVVVAVLFYFAIQNSFFKTILGILEPLTIGLVIAYLLNPLVRLVEKPFNKLFGKMLKKEKTVHSLSRGVSIFFSLSIAITLVSLIVYMLIPELVHTISGLIKDMPAMIDKTTAWYYKTVDDNELLRSIGDNVLKGIEDWVKNIDTSLIMSTAKLLTSGVFTAVGTTLDIVIGIIASIYLLFNKETYFAQIKKLMYAFFDNKRVENFIDTAREGHKITSKYIIGVIIDSAIIGVVCFILMAILRMPYQLLVSVIVAVTNVIPYFGPFIGAIPSAILILLTDPIKGIYFIIMILILQQIEGNLIAPKVIGDTTGLSPLWVMSAIIVGGGLFGFVGMVIGVPVLATLFFIIRKISNAKLVQKNMPTASAEYTHDFTAEPDEALDAESDAQAEEVNN